MDMFDKVRLSLIVVGHILGPHYIYYILGLLRGLINTSITRTFMRLCYN